MVLVSILVEGARVFGQQSEEDDAKMGEGIWVESDWFGIYMCGGWVGFGLWFWAIYMNWAFVLGHGFDPMWGAKIS